MTNRRWLDLACVGALGALALMTWQIFDPRVWPVMVAMSLGQVLGTASLAAFGYVVVTDFQAQRRAENESFGKKQEGDWRNATRDSPRRSSDPPSGSVPGERP
jgi:hypothetical protein